MLATNDLVNIGLWALGKHPELQHQLLCLAGTGSKQYRPYLGAKNAKGKTRAIDDFLLQLYPSANTDELTLLKSQLSRDSLRQLGKDAGLSDAALKELVEDGKKLERDS